MHLLVAHYFLLYAGSQNEKTKMLILSPNIHFVTLIEFWLKSGDDRSHGGAIFLGPH